MAGSWELVFENALLVDGTGAPARRGELAVAEGRIAAMDAQLPEQAKSQAARRIDAAGQVLCPGFIDVHAHGELEPPADPSAAGKVRQGVTTEISGNCGLAPFPLRGALRRRYEEEARDEFGWPPERLHWTTPAEYFAELERAGSAINRGFLAGHNSLRLAVGGLGKETPAGLESALQDALDAGCFGLSTGLVYPPGCFAPAEELRALARVCARRGALYATHMRSESDELESAVAEALETARGSGARLQISHLKTSWPRNWRKIEFLDRTLHQARREGLDFHADRYPYTASSTGLDAVLPRWAYEGGTEEELRRLQDPAVCARLETEVRSRHPESDYWQRVLVTNAVDAELNRRTAGRTIAELAVEWKVAPFEALRRILVEDRCRPGAVFFSMSEENLERILGWEFVMIGSDAAARNVTGPTRRACPHPRTFGTFPRVLARYAREKRVLSLETAVFKMTGLPARTFRLRDRGELRPDAWADLVLFRPEEIHDEADYRDPNRFPSGIPLVLVNGTPVVEHEKLLTARPGRILRFEPER